MAKNVQVTITLDVDGKSKTFIATAQTDGDTRGLAEGLLHSTSRDINRWVRYEMSDEEQ